MRIDSLQLREGGSLTNLVVPFGTAFPGQPDDGELFFRSDLLTMHAHIGGSWEDVRNATALGGLLPSHFLDFSNFTGLPTTVAGYGISDALSTNGGTLVGAITLHADPVGNLEPATKQYVDNAIAGLEVKASVVVATTENITLSGLQIIDGVSLSDGDRVLVKDQTTGSQNGIWIAHSGAWERSTDADENHEVSSGLYTYSEQGTSNEGVAWILSSPVSSITIGTDDLVFVKFSVTASHNHDSDYLSLTGGTLTGPLTGTAFNLSMPHENERMLSVQTGGVNRWRFGGDAATESGSNAGTDFAIKHYTDAGALIGNALTISRDTGRITVVSDPTANLGVATKQYVDNHSGAIPFDIYTGNESLSFYSRSHWKLSEGAASATLPNVTAADDGKWVFIKVDENASTNNLTISTPGSETISDTTSLIVNTDQLAFYLIYDHANTNWIF
jgi:phage-related tail fiber protein